MLLRMLLGSTVALALGVGTLHGAAESRQAADAFARKIALIAAYDTVRPAKPAVRRTPLTETELNSWFAFHGPPLLPEGLTQPRITIVGGGKVLGTATVDLEAVGKRRGSGSALDVWSYLGGRVPVTVTGILHTQNGQGRFDLEAADVSGVPLPKSLLQELVSYYSRTPDRPQGVRLDDAFELPAGIRQIEVAQGQAVVVQ